MLIVANPHSIPARRAPHFMLHYASTLGLNTPWRFFSPNPPIGERYLEYEVHKEGAFSEDGFDEEAFSYHYWPPKPSSLLFQANINRAFTHSIATTSSEERLRDFFIPWLCRKHPEAYSISIQAKTKRLPSIEIAQIKKTRFEFLSESYDFSLKEHLCSDH